MITVWAPYPGKVISANHMRYPNSSRLRPEAAAWQASLTRVIRVRMNYLDIVLAPPVHIRLTGRWKNRRSACDYDNLHKIIGDSIKAAIEIDDKHFRWHDGEPLFGVEDPGIDIDIWGGEDDTRTDNNNRNQGFPRQR